MTTLRISISIMIIMTAAHAADGPVQPMMGWADVMSIPAVRQAVDALPPADRATVSQAAGWVQTPLMLSDDGSRYATACKPHLCTSEFVKVVIESDGRARISIVRGR